MQTKKSVVLSCYPDFFVFLWRCEVWYTGKEDVIMIRTIFVWGLSYSAMFCAVMAANINCWVFFHQKHEPESVRKLRKF